MASVGEIRVADRAGDTVANTATPMNTAVPTT
jgi:hypothetical protein